MRDLLTILATFLVLVLTVALVGPYLVDWSAHRGFVEQSLSEALGARARIAGAIHLTLLPTPSLSVEDLSIVSNSSNGPALSASGADFELSAASLFRGELQFLKADLDRPILTTTLSRDGEISLPGPPSELPGQIDFDELRLRDATLTLLTEGRPVWTLTHIDLDARAEALSGPFSGTGSVVAGAVTTQFQFTAGSRNGDAMPLSASLSAASAPSLRLDGALHFGSSPRGAKLSYAGSADVEGVYRTSDLAIPWRIEGSARADAGGVALQKAALRIGPDRAPIQAVLTGSASFSQSSPIKIAIAAQQVDADAFFAGFGRDAKRVEEALVSAAETAFPEDGTARPLQIDLTAQALIANADSLTDTHVLLTTNSADVARLSVRTDLPAGGRFAWDGTYEAGPAAVLRGKLDIAAPDKAMLADWIAPAFPDTSARLKGLPFRSLSFSGDVDLSAAALDSRDFKLTADQTLLRGAAVYTKAIAGNRARLFADLHSDSLELDSLPDLSGVASKARDMDLDLALDARAVRLAHFGSGMVQAGRISLRLRKTGDEARLDDLTLTDLGGATLSASGSLSPTSADLDASLDAARLDELARAVARIAPGRLADALTARAIALSPAKLTLHLSTVRSSDGVYTPAIWSLRGTARGVSVNGSLKPGAGQKPASVAELDLQGKDSSILLRQVGLAVLPIADTGPGRIHAAVQAQADGSWSGRVDASIARSDFSFTGRVSDWAKDPSIEGRASVTSPDAAPFLRLATLVLPDPLLALPVTASGAVTARSRAISLSDLSGAIAGDSLSGSLDVVLDPSQGSPTLTGALALDHLSLDALTSLALGPSASGDSRSIWSKAAFSPGLTAPPSADIGLAARSLDLGFGWSGHNAALRLRLGAGLVGLDEARMSIAGGALDGNLDLRRDGSAASATGQIHLKNVRLDRPYLSGLLSGEGSFAATGASPFDLMNGLAGGGSIQIAGMRINRNAPAALPSLMVSSENEDFKFDQETVDATLAHELDRGPLELSSTKIALQAAGGQLRLTSFSMPVNDPGVFGALSGALDLRTLALRERVDLTTSTPPRDWPGAPPSLAVIWRAGAQSAGADREIEADSLIADLATRAAAREAERISDVSQDLQERAFFIRRLRGLEFLHRREAEVAAFERAQAERAKAAENSAATADALNHRSASAQPPKLLLPAPAPPQIPTGLGADPLSLGPF